MIKRKLPERLYAAYAWTEAAGELDELRDATGEALATYVRESAENFREHGDSDVTEADLETLSDWLKANPAGNTHAAE